MSRERLLKPDEATVDDMQEICDKALSAASAKEASSRGGDWDVEREFIFRPGFLAGWEAALAYARGMVAADDPQGE
ncbi:MAG: hypothetical protein NVSMB21_25040 [Vulcanimicrobiaceae bacterium]